MIEAILSFLGGSTLRMVWGEVSAYLTRKQDHQHEVERMKLQADLDAGQHARTLQSLKLQGELGVKTIEVQSEGAVDQLEAQGWLEAVKSTGRATGVRWVDAWNSAIRPGVATWGIVMLTAEAMRLLVVTDGTASVVYAFLGIFAADRSLGKRGK
jgi:hypothetical protein